MVAPWTTLLATFTSSLRADKQMTLLGTNVKMIGLRNNLQTINLFLSLRSWGINWSSSLIHGSVCTAEPGQSSPCTLLKADSQKGQHFPEGGQLDTGFPLNHSLSSHPVFIILLFLVLPGMHRLLKCKEIKCLSSQKRHLKISSLKMFLLKRGYD